ncbi:unnamed protein product [Brassica rapa]|uniref:F-box associated beta-propeller type 1 domain-containing protein n=1 Tax=Brassica campestris TaxID=3711 RepID=A0A3P6A8W9_BRACM|nr:unnamed protein product [Brassica rapa]VDC81570.1 unnamed protein product [Brassica rapa]
MRLPFDAAYHNPVTLSCVREEKLAVLFTHDEVGSEEFEMWITTKIEAEEVSRRFLRVINPLISCNCFFIDEEKKVAMGFDEVHSKITCLQIYYLMVINKTNDSFCYPNK